jgi:hypothetical protein
MIRFILVYDLWSLNEKKDYVPEKNKAAEVEIDRDMSIMGCGDLRAKEMKKIRWAWLDGSLFFLVSCTWWYWSVVVLWLVIDGGCINL